MKFSRILMISPIHMALATETVSVAHFPFSLPLEIICKDFTHSQTQQIIAQRYVRLICISLCASIVLVLGYCESLLVCKKKPSILALLRIQAGLVGRFDFLIYSHESEEDEY